MPADSPVRVSVKYARGDSCRRPTYCASRHAGGVGAQHRVHKGRTAGSATPHSCFERQPFTAATKSAGVGHSSANRCGGAPPFRERGHAVRSEHAGRSKLFADGIVDKARDLRHLGEDDRADSGVDHNGGAINHVLVGGLTRVVRRSARPGRPREAKHLFFSSKLLFATLYRDGLF